MRRALAAKSRNLSRIREKIAQNNPLARHLPGRRRRPLRHRLRPQRAPQRRLVRSRRRGHLPRRLPLLFQIHRRKSSGPRQHSRHSRRASRRRQRFRPHQQMGPHRPPLRGHRRTRPASRPHARRPIRLLARHPLADPRRSPRRLRPGFHHSIFLHAPQRKIARSNGARRSRQARRHARVTRSAGDHGDSAGSHRADRSESPERFTLGHLHSGDDHPHRDARRNLSALSAARTRSRSFDHRRRVGAVRGHRRPMGERLAHMVECLHALGVRACDRYHYLRFRCFSTTRLAAARPARLSQRLHQNRRHRCSRRRHPLRPPHSANACAHPLHRRLRPRLRRKNFPLLLHHHRMRRGQRLSTR